MSNFSFLTTEWLHIAEEAKRAEQYTVADPRYAAILCRSALEFAINWMYEHDHDLILPYDTSLASLIHAHCFKESLTSAMFREINVIRKTGNNGAHGRKVSRTESLAVLKYLFRFVSYMYVCYAEDVAHIPPFDETCIPDEGVSAHTAQEIASLKDSVETHMRLLKEKQAQLAEQVAENEMLRNTLAEQRKQVSARKVERTQSVDLDVLVPIQLSEEETRRLYIDILLKEAGWDIEAPNVREFEVDGMRKNINPSGKGFVDYVLWDDDGLPLAVVEAKKTLYDARKGKRQAELYANALEARYGQRPVLFYTNGFETEFWDDTFYPDRAVSGFYTKDELQRLIHRRQSRMSLNTFEVNRDIAGRDYQMEALKRVVEEYEACVPSGELKGKARKALLVMATGTGKTRVAIAAVDMLTKCNWAKRILFLADRNALVTQAKRRFNELLPDLTAIDLTKEKENNNTRLVFSTYQSIMNKIDSVKNEDERFYGVGHFDLIIIDEAHRSVYQKYSAIFEYFDALLLGLTATPKNEVDRNTYALFDIEDNNPTFWYELTEAVGNGYLVKPKGVTVPIKFPREGIRYKDLSPQEKEEYELKFGDPTSGVVPEEIGGNALNDWLFNADTVDVVLDFVMRNGLSVQGGDMIGKTIIFAKNHKHAQFIEKRFDKNYPEYSGKLLRVIDNYEDKAQDLLDAFSDETQNGNPQIAVSVDMLDTGVDVPEIVNLVLFKAVKSSTKYWQMIGRGTRLCPDIFAPGEDKQCFYVFDFCSNFEFFDEFPEGITVSPSKPLSQELFLKRLEFAQLLADDMYHGGAYHDLRDAHLDALHAEIAGLDRERFVVRKELRYVEAFKDRRTWSALRNSDMQEIADHLSHLAPTVGKDDELAKRFDLLVLRLQIYTVIRSRCDKDTLIQRIVDIGKALEKKENIPHVKTHIELIKLVQTEEFWRGVDLITLEEIREALRGLIKFIDKDARKNVYTGFKDELLDGEIHHRDIVPITDTDTGRVKYQTYREKVTSFIRGHKNHITIQRLYTNQPITSSELGELERILISDDCVTRDEYKKTCGDMPLGCFIRSILGLDITAANEAFAEFMQHGDLTANQMTFVKQIINYLNTNGTIDKELLFEPPFTDIHYEGVTGVFDEVKVVQLVHVLDVINNNAKAVDG